MANDWLKNDTLWKEIYKGQLSNDQRLKSVSFYA